MRRNSEQLCIGELADDLVYAASGSIVDTTVVAGRVLMQGGEIPGSEEVIARALASAPVALDSAESCTPPPRERWPHRERGGPAARGWPHRDHELVL